MTDRPARLFDEARARADICDAMRELETLGLNRGTSGNVSVRSCQGMLITPSGVPVPRLTPESIVALDAGGAVLDPAARPSSEWRFHQEIYLARTDIGAVVHVHSAHATALSCQNRPIPAFHYMVAVAGGDDIPCTRYATFGSAELATEIALAIRDRQACLIANHGMLAIAKTLSRAVALAVEVETLAEQYQLACIAGQPRLLSSREMALVLEKFKTYGERDDAE